jgi:uncharacterized membrane protein
MGTAAVYVMAERENTKAQRNVGRYHFTATVPTVKNPTAPVAMSMKKSSTVPLRSHD